MQLAFFSQNLRSTTPEISPLNMNKKLITVFDLPMEHFKKCSTSNTYNTFPKHLHIKADAYKTRIQNHNFSSEITLILRYSNIKALVGVFLTSVNCGTYVDFTNTRKTLEFTVVSPTV